MKIKTNMSLPIDCGLKRLMRALLMMAMSFALIACGKQTPGCADAELATIATDLVRGSLESKFKDVANHDNGIISRELKSIQVRFINATDQGYNKETKKRICNGTIDVSTSWKGLYQRQTDYAAQVTSDGKQVLLETPRFAFSFVVEELMQSLSTRADAERFDGAWNGALKCNGVGGETTGPKGPISRPVSIVFNKSNQMTLERTTLVGGIEKLSGSANLMSGLAVLNGEGMNSAEDQWIAEYAGKFQGKTMVLVGAIMTPDRKFTLRNCRIEVTQNGPLIAETVVPPVSPDTQSPSSLPRQSVTP